VGEALDQATLVTSVGDGRSDIDLPTQLLDPSLSHIKNPRDYQIKYEPGAIFQKYIINIIIIPIHERTRYKMCI